MESQHTLQAYYEQFLIDLETNGRAGATVIAYGKDLEQFLDFLKEKQQKTTIDAVTGDDIEQFKHILASENYTDKSIYRKVNSIKSFFRFLRKKGVISENPADAIAHPKYSLSDPRILTKMEYRALRDACRADKRISTIVEVLLQTGMRISELANLEVADVDFAGKLITIRPQESHGQRAIPLNNAALSAVDEYMQIRPTTRQKALFVTKTCRPFLVRNIRTAIDRYFRLAGIKDAKVNDLRHTFVVQQLAAGTPLVYVSQLVGHKRITTTEKYLKLLQTNTDFQAQMRVEEL